MKIKELQGRTEELEAWCDLSRELKELAERLKEAAGNTQAQIELSKRREAGMAKLRCDLEEASLDYESTLSLSNIRKKQAIQLTSLSEQTESLQCNKQKLEKEKSEIKMEVDELTVNVESLTKSKLNFEKQARSLEDIIAEYKLKNEGVDSQLSRMSMELNDLRRQIEEKDYTNFQMVRNKNLLGQTNDELKRHLEEEASS